MLKRILYCLMLFATYYVSFSQDLKEDYDQLIEVFKEGDHKKTKEKALSFLSIAKSTNDYYYLCKSYFLLGYISEFSDDFGMAIIYYLEGSRFGQLSEDHNIKRTVISIHKNLSTILGDYKHYSLAHKFLDEAINFAQDLKDEAQIESLFNNKIHELIEERRYTQALSLIDSIQTHLNISNSKRIAFLNKAGVAHHELGDLKEALNYYTRVIDDSTSYGSDIYAICLLNIGTIHFEKSEYIDAIHYLDKAISYCQSYDLRRWLFKTYQKLGETYFHLNKIDLSIRYFNKAIELVEYGDQDAQAYEVYKLISDVYTSISKYEKALKYKQTYSFKLEEYIAQQAEITQQEQKYNIKLLTDRYYDLLAADLDQKKTERLAKFGIGGTTLFFLSILFVIWYRQRRTRLSLAKELNAIEWSSEV